MYKFVSNVTLLHASNNLNIYIHNMYIYIYIHIPIYVNVYGRESFISIMFSYFCYKLGFNVKK